MTAVLPIARAEPLAARGWREHLSVLAGAWVGLLLLFHRDAAGMAAIWWESSTFNHCMLIVPLIGWLVWQRLPELRRLAPAAWMPGLLLVAAGAGGWLLGDAGGIALARHAGLILMLQGAVIACLGKAVARGLAFPIFYAVFLIPLGDQLVPVMQTVTADICMVLLALARVPATIQGVFISTPTGYFEVAEACSGVKFLVAMVAYGALVANVCFRTWPRRVAFMAAAVVIPILANGLRAWGTIYVAYLTRSNAFAESFDHVVYGWVFFAIVIALLMAVGWRFFDRKVDDPWFDPSDLQPPGTEAGPRHRLVTAAAAVLALAAVPPLWSAAIASTGTQPAPADIAMPQVPGWQQVRATGRAWQPHFAGADLVRMVRYRNAAGQEADLAIIVFARQAEGRELVGFGQGAVRPESEWAWTADAPAPPSGKAERIFSHGTIREVVSFYRVGHILTGSAGAVKVETVKTRLLGGPQRAVAVLVSSEAHQGDASARPAIDAFLSSLGSVEELADAAAGLPGTF
jgi:exosortase A